MAVLHVHGEECSQDEDGDQLESKRPGPPDDLAQRGKKGPWFGLIHGEPAGADPVTQHSRKYRATQMHSDDFVPWWPSAMAMPRPP
jgi:hypothetical protein